MNAEGSEQKFRYAVLGGAAVLVGLLTVLRFCGDVSLPAKPPKPSTANVASDELLMTADRSPIAYRGYLEKDAATAGVPVPSVAEMSKRFPYRSDDARATLEVGGRPLEAAGLRMSAIVLRDGGEDALVLQLENLTDANLAYRVVARPSGGAAQCHSRPVIRHNAMVVARGAVEKRSECRYRKGMYLHVDHVETIELNPLSAVYVSRVPPSAVGGDQFATRGHRPQLAGQALCNVVLSRSTAVALEQGDVTWRDLVDFHARHRCDSYGFFDSYRAFSKDGERPLPAVP